MSKSSLPIWHYTTVHNVKSTVKILSIFVTFLENTNFKIKILLQKGFQSIACSLIYGFFECFECAIHFTLSTKGVLFCPYCLPFFDWSFSQWCQQKTTLAQQFGTLIVFTNFYVSPYFWAMVWVCSPVEYLLEFDLLCT